jgi:hypothetical protein
MSEEAIAGEELAVSVLVERDGQQIRVPLADWLAQQN